MSKYSQTNHFSQQNFCDCPRTFRKLLHGGKQVWWRCRRRTCSSITCREWWSHREFVTLDEAHYWNPFNKRLTIKFPSETSDDERLDTMHHWMENCRRWLRRNKSEFFDMQLFPDQHGQQPLHWHGVVRASKKAAAYFRSSMKRLKLKTKVIYGFKDFKSWRGWCGYAVGRKHQHEMEVMRCGKRRLLLRIGKPYYARKKDVYFISRLRRECPGFGI